MQNITTENTFSSRAYSVLHNIVTWKWTKTLLYWIIMSAGTMSECAFLVASLWMTLNSSVHKLVLLRLTEEQTVHISELATAAYVALPECILALAVVTVIIHFRVYLYDRSKSELTWSILYGAPTLVFLVLSMITLGCSVASTSFILPLPLIVLRALAGYVFAFTSLLNVYLGEPQIKDKLQHKDGIIAELKNQYNADVSLLIEKSAAMLDGLSQDKDKVIASLKAELENQKALLQQSKTVQSELIKAVKKSDDEALQAYSDDCKNWLKSEVKTASIEEIMRFTGISKRKIEGAINKKQLLLSPRNKELILMSSLTPWLKTINNSPSITLPKTDELPALHIVNS